MSRLTEADQLLTSIRTAERIGVKPQTLRLWRHQGKGPQYIRLGDTSKARVGYFESDILDWLNERRFSSTTEETESQRVL
jgi:predicted DNA-binding transcriptional regulator AlpA